MRTLSSLRSNRKILSEENFDSEFVIATGGSLKYFKDNDGKEYVLHVFYTSGFFTLSATKTCDILLVGGGGSGGPGYGNMDTGKGGGGAGGVQFRQNYSLSAGEYEIGVGRGGRPALHDRGYNGEDNFRFNMSSRGGSTTWQDVSDTTGNGGVIANGGGGGGGGDNDYAPQKGGSGGGAGARSSSYTVGAISELASFSGWTKYGNAGGNSANGNYGGGGGGGATGAGGNHGSSGNLGTTANAGDGGYGGTGINMSGIFGIEVGDDGWFAGGGAGGTYYHAAWSTDRKVSLGGKGGGGNGVWGREQSNFDYNNMTADNKSFKIDGMDGTGGGGGGSSEGNESQSMHGAQCGLGGSGIAIVRYEIT